MLWKFTLYFDVWIHCWHQSFFTIHTYKLDLAIIGNLKTIKIYFVMSKMLHLNVLSLKHVIYLVHYSLSPFSILTLMLIASFYLIWKNILAFGVFILFEWTFEGNYLIILKVLYVSIYFQKWIFVKKVFQNIISVEYVELIVWLQLQLQV